MIEFHLSENEHSKQIGGSVWVQRCTWR